MARKRNIEETPAKSNEQPLVLSDPGQAAEKKPEGPKVVNITPDGRIKRIDF